MLNIIDECLPIEVSFVVRTHYCRISTELDGKTAKMYRGGKICMTDHFKPLWSKHAPKFGLAHAMALGLGPWLAVEIPDLLQRGVIAYKEKGDKSDS